MIDSSKISISSGASAEITEGIVGNGMKITWDANGSGKATFKPIIVEENANKVVFEYSYINNYDQVYKILFYAGSANVYDCQFNAGVTFTSETNSISWGISSKIGVINTIRF